MKTVTSLKALLICALCFVSCKDKITSSKYAFALEKTDKIVLTTNSGAWDEHTRENGNIIKVDDKLVQVYSGYKGDYEGDNVYVGLSISNDNGKTWVKGGINNNGNIIPNHSMEDPYIIYDTIQKKYYLYAEDKKEVPFRNIRMYSSFDLKEWKDEGDVLDIGEEGEFDAVDVSSPVAIKKGEDIYLYYEGRSKGNGGQMGIAISKDYKNFVKYQNNPVLTGTSSTWSKPDVLWASHLVPDDIFCYKGVYYITHHAYTLSDKYFAAGLAKSDNLLDWQDEGRILEPNSHNKKGQDICFYKEGEEVKFLVIDQGKRYVAAIKKYFR